MNSILSKFGITEKLLGSAHLYEKVVSNKTASSMHDIKKAIKSLTPESCGMSLVRVGPKRDGGYLVPNDMVGIEACFSPGTNNFKDFEDHLAKAYGIKSFMCDYSSDVEKFRTPLIDGCQFFEKKWLDVEESDIAIDVNKWVKSNTSNDSDLILQMDIEGAEYRNLLHASIDTLSKFRIIVLEIHNLGLLSKSEFLDGVFNPVFERINRIFKCVHAHPNNCCGETVFGDNIIVPNVLELTFLRKDRFKSPKLPLELPHKLDVLNVPSKPPLCLSGVLCENADSIRSENNSSNQAIHWLVGEVRRLQGELINNQLTADITSFLLSKMVGEKNIARGKFAKQSSISSYSTSEGSGGAINGVKTGKFGFHTNIEENPWWSVDLGRDYFLDEILIYNRLDACQERIRRLAISVSADNSKWVVVYEHNNRPPFGGVKPFRGAPPLLVHLNHMVGRYVKLECLEKTALHLDQVEIFGIECS